jgi:hypothetical protein
MLCVNPQPKTVLSRHDPQFPTQRGPGSFRTPHGSQKSAQALPDHRLFRTSRATIEPVAYFSHCYRVSNRASNFVTLRHASNRASTRHSSTLTKSSALSSATCGGDVCHLTQSSKLSKIFRSKPQSLARRPFLGTVAGKIYLKPSPVREWMKSRNH